MSFIDDLKKGLPGLRFVIPDTWKRQEEQDRRVVLIDSEHRVGWHILHAPWRVDLRRENFDLMRRDIERHARFGFEQHYHQVPVPSGQAAAQRPPVRTTDPEFSPLVWVDTVDIGGVTALLSIRRVAYEPLIEAVVGNLLIPLATGLVDITVFQHTQETGYRESGLLNLALQKYPGENVQKLARRLGQAHFDDPQFDSQFPTHPLTCVRGAFRWLRSLPADQFGITAAPAELPPIGTPVELAAVGCTVTPPPRYVQVPPGVLPLPPGVVLLSRVILEGADDPQMLDVRQVSGVKLAPEGRQDQLLKLMQRQVEEWQRNGAVNIELSWEPVDVSTLPASPVTGDGERVAIATQVSMLVGGAPTHTVARWIADTDGRVFRIGVATPPYIPLAEAAADADAVLRSFKRQQIQTKGTTAWLTSDLRLAPLKRGSAPNPQ